MDLNEFYTEQPFETEAVELHIGLQTFTIEYIFTH